MIEKEHVLPVRILRQTGDVTHAENLMLPFPRQIPVYWGEPAIPTACLRGRSSLLLDFGREMRGGLGIACRRAHSAAGSTAHLHIRFGESAAECCASLGEKGACNDHSPRDFSIPLVSMSYGIWGQTGFRFALLEVEDADAEIQLRAVTAEGDILSLPTRYVYTGADPLVQQIYETAKRTIDLCAAGEYVWDGIKRDRLVWIGDMHPEMLALCTLYGRTEVFENSMRLLMETTPAGEWMCGIDTYSAWWIICLSDYVARTGATEFARPLIPYAQGILRQVLALAQEDGELLPAGRTLVDWPTHEKPDEMAGRQAIFLYMAERAVTLLDALGEDTAVAQELRRRLQRKEIRVTHAMQVAGLKFMATGSLPPEDVALLERLGADGMSTFMSYYILTAYAHYFGRDRALSLMKEYYGGMLSRGATTFWEDFHLSWLDGAGRIDALPQPGERDLHGDYGDYCYIGYRHSLCHAWSTGVLAFMAEQEA